MELAKIRMPNLNTPGLSADKKLGMVTEYMLALEKQMRYVLSNIETDNLSASLNETLSAAEQLKSAGYGEQIKQKVSKGDVVNGLTETKTGRALDAAQGRVLDEKKLNTADFGKKVLECVYPVGAIYLSVAEVSPETLLGGTWERMEDTFLLAGGQKYEPGSKGGEAEVELTEKQLPKHSHYALYYAGDETLVSLNDGTGGYQLSCAEGTGTTEYSDFVTGSAGNGEKHNNMPPYTAVYVWKRTA